MRGRDTTRYMMVTLKTPGQLVPEEHPLRRVKVFMDQALKEMSGLFDEMYSDVGRPSSPPEQLLKATLLMAFVTVRSEAVVRAAWLQRLVLLVCRNESDR